MFDARLRRLAGRPLDRLGAALADRGVPAVAVTLAGFAAGILAIPALALQAYGVALALILANRAFDGLDGAVARHAGPTDFGGFIDIVCDFVVYAGFVFGFACGRPDMALPAAFLIFSFVGTGTSFLAFAIAAAKRGISTDSHGLKSFYYLGGLTEATETTALFAAVCLWPEAFAWLAYGFGALCWVTTATRVAQARLLLADSGRPT
jgi:phosphatidylglycerophosphate synthase